MTDEEKIKKVSQLARELLLIMKFEDDLYLCESALGTAWITLIIKNIEKKDRKKHFDFIVKSLKESLMKESNRR